MSKGHDIPQNVSQWSKIMVRTFLRTVVQTCVVLFSLLFLDSPILFGQSTNPFVVPPTFAGDGQMFSADLNGDGKPDLLFTDGTVLLGKGDGTFTIGISWKPTGSFTTSQLAIADFNGDGKQDILLAGPLNQLSVLLGNGDGTFQSAVITSIAVPPSALLVGDLDGDGRADVLAQVGSNFSTFLSNGDGTFAAAITSNAVTVSVFDAFADFNGDGKLDLVTGEGVQLGNGNGTFRALLPFPSGALSGTVVGDFDGDGRLDVVASGGSSSSPQIQVLFGNGDGTFLAGTIQSLPAIATTSNLVSVDLNGDGKADLVGSGVDAVQVLIGKGDGTFVPGKLYNAPQGDPPNGSTNLVVADFNGDNKKDVAAFNTMLLSNGDGTLQGDEAVPALAGNGTSGDFNGDGFPDLALIANATHPTLAIWLNDGKSNFTLAHSYQIPIPTPGNFGGSLTISSAIDINGDGKVDLVGYIWDASGLTLIGLLGNGDGSFGAPISSRINNDSFSNGITGLTLGDLNGDGNPDVLVNAAERGSCCTLNVLLNNGDGSFSAPTTPFVGTPRGNITVGDFNNDKKLDVVVGTTSGIAVALGNGDGTFQPTTFIANAVCQTLCENPLSGDFNGDGNLDLIFPFSSGYQVLIGKGDGTFIVSPAVALSAGSLDFYQPVGQVADFNGDGHLDVLGAFSSNSLGLLMGNGDGTFGSVFSLPVVLTTNGATSPATVVGDFNGDRRTDIASLSSVQLVWLFNNGAQAETPPPPPAPPDFSVGSGSGGGTATVSAGSSATYPISVTGSGGFNGTVALTCSVSLAGPTCSVSPSSVAVSGGKAATATVSVMTTARSELLPTGVPSNQDSSRRILWVFGAFLAAAGVITLLANTQVRPRRFAWSLATACGAILLLSASLISGCGGGSNSSGSNGSSAIGTPAGNYTITVAATAGSGANAVGHTTKLTLVVQ